MRIAVTGATGFIGRHVLKELAALGIETVAVAGPSSAPPPSTPDQRFASLDVLSASADCFDRLGRPDALIHLAWGGLPNYRSLHHFEQELPGHYRFLKGMVKSGLKTLVAAGTCFEYGMQSGPLNEALPALPNNPYGFAKDCLRRQLEHLRAAQPFHLVWPRLFYLYGEGQVANSLFPQLQRAVERGAERFDMSGGEQLRDYLPVAEAAKLIVALAMKQANLGVVNICSGQPISIRRLVEGWIAEHNWSIGLNLGHYPYPDYEPMAFWGDRSKLARLLEARP